MTLKFTFENTEKYDVYKDIIIMPLFTKELCTELVKVSDYYKDEFKNNISFRNNYEKNKIGWDDLNLSEVSNLAFREYTELYRQHVCPVLEKTFGKNSHSIDGWFSPTIIRYDRVGQATDIHHDVSHITLNVKLNNDYQGCDLYFPRQDFNAKDVPIGHAMIWPGAVTHPHYSTPLESGTKYSFVSWTWPPAWQAEGIENSVRI